MAGIQTDSPATLAAEITQGRWLIVADTMQPPAAPTRSSAQHWLGLITQTIAHKRTIALWSGIGLLLGLAISSMISNRYTATTQLLPPPSQSPVSALLGQFSDLASFAGRDGFRAPGALYVVLLRSRSVTQKLVERFDLMHVYGTKKLSDCLLLLEKRTQVEALKEGLIVVKVDDSSPQRAAALANGYVSELISLNQRLAVGEASRRRIFFEQQVKDQRDELAAAEQELKRLQESNGMLQPEAQARLSLEGAALLRAHIALKRAQLQQLRMVYAEEGPDVLRLKTELRSLETELKAIEGKSEQTLMDMPISKIPAAGLDYIRRMREVKYDEAVLEALTKQLELARIDEAKEGALIQVVDRADVPDRKSGPSRAWITLLSACAGFSAGIVWVVAKNAFSRAALDPEVSRELSTLRTQLRQRPIRNGN